MKKVTFLLLLLLSNLIIYAQSNTKNTVEISEAQVTELYKIAKQNDFLKDLAKKQETELANAKILISDQKKSLEKYSKLSKEKDNLLEQKEFETSKMLESKDVEIKMLRDIAKANATISKRNERKSFWRGFTYGGITIGLVGSATAIYLISR